jgi:UDPglucose 6-dehydrogenase
VNAHDPQALERTREIFGDRIHYHDNFYNAVKGAKILMVLTEWREFEQLDMMKIMESMQEEPILFDGRNIYDPKKMKEMGFKYIGVGI